MLKWVMAGWAALRELHGLDLVLGTKLISQEKMQLDRNEKPNLK